MKTTQKLDQIVHALLRDMDAHPLSRRLCTGVLSRAEYIAFLVQSYHYVVHSRPLLRQSGERLVRMGKPEAGRLFLGKAEEENGHEQWIRNDLVALGEEADIVCRVKPVPGVCAYVAWNSYMVAHDSPVAFLGAAYILEAISAIRAGSVAKKLVGNSGIANIADAVMFLSGHGDADVEHIVILGRNIEALDITEKDRERMILTADLTRVAYMGLYTGISAVTGDEPATSTPIPVP